MMKLTIRLVVHNCVKENQFLFCSLLVVFHILFVNFHNMQSVKNINQRVQLMFKLTIHSGVVMSYFCAESHQLPLMSCREKCFQFTSIHIVILQEIQILCTGTIFRIKLHQTPCILGTIAEQRYFCIIIHIVNFSFKQILYTIITFNNIGHIST